MMIHVRYCKECSKLFHTASKKGKRCNRCLSELGKKFSKNLTRKQEQQYLYKKLKMYRRKKK